MQAPDNNNNHLLCQGTTSDGLPCKRTPSASAGNGFCYQHQSQDQGQHDHDIDDDQQSMDLEEEEDQIKEEEVQEQEPVDDTRPPMDVPSMSRVERLQLQPCVTCSQQQRTHHVWRLSPRGGE